MMRPTADSSLPVRASSSAAAGFQLRSSLAAALAIGLSALAIAQPAAAQQRPLDHEDVMAWAETAGRTLAPFLEAVVPKLADDSG